MKKTFKIICSLLMLSFLFVVFNVQATTKGSSETFNVNIVGKSNIQAGAISLSYDNTALELTNASWKIAEKSNDKTLVVIGNFDIPRDESTPFFLKGLGFDSIPDELNQNILQFNKDKLNLIATKNRYAWQGFVASNYGKYIPSYIR